MVKYVLKGIKGYKNKYNIKIFKYFIKYINVPDGTKPKTLLVFSDVPGIHI